MPDGPAARPRTASPSVAAVGLEARLGHRNGPEYRPGLVHGFFPLQLRLGVGDNARTRLDVESVPGDDGGSAITNYKVERESPIGGGWSQIALLGVTTSYSDNTVVGGTQYNYRVRAVNAIGDGAFGDPANATTPAGVPTAPQTLTATAISATRIDLGWNAPTSDGGSTITGYKIERESPIGNGFTFLTNVGVVYNYSDTTCVTSTQYNYRVFAINGVGTGPASNEADDTTP